MYLSPFGDEHVTQDRRLGVKFSGTGCRFSSWLLHASVMKHRHEECFSTCSGIWYGDEMASGLGR